MSLQYKFKDFGLSKLGFKHISFIFMSHDNYTKQQQLSPLAVEAP